MFCDVAILPSNALIDLSATGSFLVVFARIVSTEDVCNIRVKINRGSRATLKLYIFQLSQVLNVTFTGDVEPAKYVLNPKSNAILVDFTFDGTHMQVVQSDTHNSTLGHLLKQYPIACRFVKCQLRIAALASCSLPPLSTHILDFLHPLIPLLPQDECSHTPSLVEQVGRGNGIGIRNSVSPLSLMTCRSSVEQSLHAAWSFRTEYERFVDKKNPIEQVEAAQSAAAGIDNLIAEQRAVANETENRRQNAQSAQREAYSNLLV